MYLLHTISFYMKNKYMQYKHFSSFSPPQTYKSNPSTLATAKQQLNLWNMPTIQFGVLILLVSYNVHLIYFWRLVNNFVLFYTVSIWFFFKDCSLVLQNSAD